mmetsp:Transcript_32156/g.84969  ORF Transcript_32156/g.84969 Transcript_32156/m.84969 type:complete len:197 (-) Transcript_32156:31-621(-)
MTSRMYTSAKIRTCTVCILLPVLVASAATTAADLSAGPSSRPLSSVWRRAPASHSDPRALALLSRHRAGRILCCCDQFRCWKDPRGDYNGPYAVDDWGSEYGADSEWTHQVGDTCYWKDSKEPKARDGKAENEVEGCPAGQKSEQEGAEGKRMATTSGLKEPDTENKHAARSGVARGALARVFWVVLPVVLAAIAV